MRGFYFIWLSEKKKKMVYILYNWLIIIVYYTLNNIYYDKFYYKKRGCIKKKPNVRMLCYVSCVMWVVFWKHIPLGFKALSFSSIFLGT